jgi:hypothetical protein
MGNYNATCVFEMSNRNIHTVKLYSLSCRWNDAYSVIPKNLAITNTNDGTIKIYECISLLKRTSLDTYMVQTYRGAMFLMNTSLL